MIKAIVSDLDGTLLNEHHQISEFTRETLIKIIDEGIPFIVATGRHHCDVYHYIEGLGGDIFYITSNGARVHSDQHRLVYSDNVNHTLVSDIFKIASKHDVHVNVYRGDYWYVEELNEELRNLHVTSEFHYQTTKLSSMPYDEVAKIFFIAERDQLEPLRLELNERFGDQLSITYSMDNSLEVMGAGVSKGKALRAVLEHKKVCPSETIAFGDGMNDIQMLNTVGHPVVMGNAQDDLKNALSDYNTALSNKEHGVAAYLRSCFGY